MPYITQLDSSLVTVGTDGVVSISATDLVNIYGPGQEFDGYDVGNPNAPGADTLENGENFQTVVVDANGDATVNPTEYTFLGTSTITNAGPINVGVPGVLNVSALVNPINGSIVSANGNFYFVSEEPLDADHVSATLSVAVGTGTVTVTAPISEVADDLLDAVAAIPLAGPAVALTLSGVLDDVQDNLNTVAISGTLNTAGTDDIPPDELFCFVVGTMINTDHGYVAIEDIREGDMVFTKDHGFQPVRWIGSTKLTAAGLAAKPKLQPIRIKAGALGNDTPSSDLFVSPQHRILIRSKIARKMFSTDEVLVAAKQLLILDGIAVSDSSGGAEYYHILFDRHEIVIANGAEAESLYTGPEAIKAVGKSAQEEIFTLFPELRERDYIAISARVIPSGRLGRRLAFRHLQNEKPLIQ